MKFKLMSLSFAAWISFLFLVLATPCAVAQEGELQVVDEVIAQVNDDVITLSMLKRENKERIEALKQGGMTEQQATEEVNKRQPELIATLVNEQLLMQKGKELELSSDVEAEVNRFPDQLGHILELRNSRGNGLLTGLIGKGRDAISDGAIFCKRLIGQA